MCVCVHDDNMLTTSAAVEGKQILMGHLQSAPSSPARERHLLGCCLQLMLRWYPPYIPDISEVSDLCLQLTACTPPEACRKQLVTNHLTNTQKAHCGV